MVNHKLNEHLMSSASNGGSVLGIMGVDSEFWPFGPFSGFGRFGPFGPFSGFGRFGPFGPFLGFALLGFLSISGHSVHFSGLGGLGGLGHFRDFGVF